MDMASLLAAQQLLAGSGGSSLTASQQQQLVRRMKRLYEHNTFNQEDLQTIFQIAAATNEQQLAAVVSKSAAAIARQVIFSRFQVLLSSIVICWPGIK